MGKKEKMIEKEEDLQALVDNSVLECKTIEYKQALPSNSDSDKKEFLAVKNGKRSNNRFYFKAYYRGS